MYLELASAVPVPLMQIQQQYGIVIILTIITPRIQLLMSATSKYKSTPTFSFKGRNKSITSSNDPFYFPSPNKYNPEKLPSKKSPQVRFAQSKRMEWDDIKNKTFSPGPGSHETKSYISDGPKKTISRTRFRQVLNKNPSPGEYSGDHSFLKRKSPSFSMMKKTVSNREIDFKNNLNKPSPLQYQPILKPVSTKISIGKAKRPDYILSKKSPGPGAYDSIEGFKNSQLTDSKCRIGKEIRKIDFSLGERSPGPGNYDSKSNFEQNQKKRRGYSCRPKTFFKNHLDSIPGPGQYETAIMNRSRSVAGIKVPQSARPSFTQKSAQIYKNIPGPGTHQLESLDKSKFRSMSVHKFSKSKVAYELNPHKSVEHLSPSSYHINESLNRNRSTQVLISKNSQKGLFTAKIAKKPGPGHYEPKQALIRKSEFVHKLQTSERSNMIKHVIKNPGPGEYTIDVTERLGTKFKFTKSARNNIVQQRIRKGNSIVNESYESREQFPNPPRYMGVSSKLKFDETKRSQKRIHVNEQKMSKYAE